MQPNPGTAIQDDYDTELNPEITLEPGQKELQRYRQREIKTKQEINISQLKLQMLVKERSLDQ